MAFEPYNGQPETEEERLARLKQQIGFSDEPVLDADGYWTIGYGRRLSDTPGGPAPQATISEPTAREELQYFVDQGGDPTTRLGMQETQVADADSSFGHDQSQIQPNLPPEMSIPPGASLDQNIGEARSHWNPLWFYNQVRNRKGEADYRWDYKQADKKYEDFGNFNYGATGAALGLPDEILKRGAGWAQGQAGSRTTGHWWGSAPYGDDPRDQEMIQKGIDYYKKGRR